MNDITYKTYPYTEEDSHLARFVWLDNPQSYPFDNFHAHEYNEIMIFLEGGGVHNISFRDYPITDYSIHLVAAQDLHWVERSFSSKGFAVVYKEQFLYQLKSINAVLDYQNIFDDSRIIKLSAEEQTKFSLLFQEIINNSDEKVYTLQLIAAMLTKIATAFYHVPATPRSNDPLLQKVMSLIHKNFSNNWTIAQYAASLNVSSRTLCDKIKKTSGKTLRQLVQDRLLKEAKQRLVVSDKNISEIAFDLGFNEPAHFTNWFKTRTGVTPSAFKM